MGDFRPTYQRQCANKGLKERDHDGDWYDKDCDGEWDWRDEYRYYDWYVPQYNRAKGNDSCSIDPKKFKTKDVLTHILMHVEGISKIVRELKCDLSKLNRTEISYSASIEQKGGSKLHLT